MATVILDARKLPMNLILIFSKWGRNRPDFEEKRPNQNITRVMQELKEWEKKKCPVLAQIKHGNHL
jgi:hypothetical protein